LARVSFNYAKLKGRIIEKCGTQKAFAKRLGIYEATLTQKLGCRSLFSQVEIFKAMEILDILPEHLSEYFFTENVQ
jgi:hypothetical protein